MSHLQARLLAAHTQGDKTAFVGLYTEAADAAHSDDEAGFFLTHAHIYALEQNHGDAPALRARLIAMGRES